MTDDKDGVGYGRPPKSGQFRKGQSGNPKGRRKGSKNATTVLAHALSKPVVVTEDGQRRTITKLEAAVTQLANKAASGDQKATAIVLKEVGGDGRPEPLAQEERLTAEDREVLKAIRQRMKQTNTEDDDD